MSVFEIICSLCLIYLGIVFAIMLIGEIILYIAYYLRIYSLYDFFDKLKKSVIFMVFPGVFVVAPIFCISFLLSLATK